MTGRQDAVLNELKFKVERLIKLYIARVANAISGNNDGNYQAKMRINQLVREIDKCIALLNN